MHRCLLRPSLFLYSQLSTSNSQYWPWWCSTWRPFTLMPKRSCFRWHSIINIHWRLWNLLWNPAWCCFRWQFHMMSTWWFEMTAIFTLKPTWCCFRWQFPMMSTWWFEMTAIFTLKPTWCCFRWQFPMMSTWWFEMTAIFTLKPTWCCFSKYVLDDNHSVDAKMVSVARSRQRGVFIPQTENLG